MNVYMPYSCYEKLVYSTAWMGGGGAREADSMGEKREVRKLVSRQILSLWFLRKRVFIPPMRVLNLLYLDFQKSNSLKLFPMGSPSPIT